MGAESSTEAAGEHGNATKASSESAQRGPKHRQGLGTKQLYERALAAQEAAAAAAAAAGRGGEVLEHEEAIGARGTETFDLLYALPFKNLVGEGVNGFPSFP